MLSPAVQLYAFLVLVLTGVAGALGLDLYRAWRFVCRPRGALAHLADAAFALLTVLLVATGVFLSNWGEVRLYVAVALALGAALYHRLATPAVQPAARAGWRLVRAAVRWAGRSSLRPARFAGLAVARAAVGLAAPAARGGRRAAVTLRRRLPRNACVTRHRVLGWARRALGGRRPGPPRTP